MHLCNGQPGELQLCVRTHLGGGGGGGGVMILKFYLSLKICEIKDPCRGVRGGGRIYIVSPVKYL